MSKEFFIITMQEAIRSRRAECLRLAEGHPDAIYIRRMADSYQDITSENYPYAVIGTAGMDALGHALLTMTTALWERFYQGYVEWAKDTEKCMFKGREEENARGAMLLALKGKIEYLERQLEKKAA